MCQVYGGYPPGPTRECRRHRFSFARAAFFECKDVLTGLSVNWTLKARRAGPTSCLRVIRPRAVDTCHPLMVRYDTLSDEWNRHMTAADFRRTALSLEGVEEYPHAGLPAFRVGGRKLASLASLE